MKLKNLIYTALAAVILMAAGTGCTKSTFNINKNPNQPTDSTVSYDVILPSALNNTGRYIARDWGWLQNWLGYWARSGTYAPNVAEETYQVTTSFQANIWTDIYDNLYDYQTMQIGAVKSGGTFYAGIARIMKAHNYQILVDLYNNVPYTQALKGNANITPKYDKGIDIYKDLFRQIDTGIGLIDGAAVGTTGPNRNIATDDIMFAGDKTKWAKFGNTLKLRLLVHLKNVAGFDFAGEAAKIVANGKGYLGAGENAQVQPGYKSDKPNPFYNLYVADPTGTATQNSVYYKANSYAISYYEYDFDPRETRFYKAGNQGMRGVAYGLPSANENTAASLSAIGDGVAKTNSSVQWILTATESLFLQAEAMQRGYITGNPVTTLNAAITESFALVGATGAAAYIAGNATYPDVDITASSNKYYTILQQKWFALNAIAPYEVWTDYRRENSPATGTQAAADHFIYGGHGYPVAGANPVDFAIGPPISVSPSNTATKIPIRLLYPQNEYNYNAANVGAEGTISANTSKIFWDN